MGTHIQSLILINRLLEIHILANTAPALKTNVGATSDLTSNLELLDRISLFTAF